MGRLSCTFIKVTVCFCQDLYKSWLCSLPPYQIPCTNLKVQSKKFHFLLKTEEMLMSARVRGAIFLLMTI